MIPIILFIIILISSIYYGKSNRSISDGIGVFIITGFAVFVILIFVYLIVFTDTTNQEMVTTEKPITSFIDSKDNPIYVKYSFKWNGGSTYRYVEQNGKYPEYNEISIKSDVNVVEGNYDPVLIVHSYVPTKKAKFLFGSVSTLFTHGSWYEFYIPDGTFITY